MFDGVYHYYQGLGVYVLATNPYVSVQSQMLQCNLGAPYFVSCVRDARIEIKAPGSGKPSDIVHFGTWWCSGTTGAVCDDTPLVNGVALDLNVAAAGYSTPNQNAKLVYTAASKSWTVAWTSPASAFFPPGASP